jgi:DNA-binding CsgD family transcriptional regulator
MKSLKTDPEALSKLFILAMEAAVNSDAWRAICDHTAEIHDAAAFMVFAYDLKAHAAPIFFGSRAAWEEAAPFREQFQEEGAEDDRRGYGTLSRAGAGVILNEAEFCGLPKDADPPPSAYRESLLSTVGARARFGMKLNDIGPFLDVAIYHSLQDGPAHHDRLMGDAAIVQPILAKTLETSRVVAALAGSYALLLDLFDRLDFAVAFCDAAGRVLNANRRLHGMVGERDGLVLVGGSLAAGTPEATRALRDCVASALTGAAEPSALATALPRRSGRVPLLLRAAPVNDPGRDRPQGVALVLALDPEDDTGLSSEGFAAFGLLSPAELDVCRHLVRGLDAGGIAQARETSVETARGQVKTIRAKLGVASRLELLRLALATTPRLDLGSRPPDGG